MAERLPVVGGDDGAWGTVLNNWLLKEHYDTNDGNTNASNGMHKGVTIRAGTASVAPLTFTTTSAALLTTPAAGTMEIDSSGLLYYTQTSGSGNRRRVMYYDDASAATGDIFYRDSGGNIVRLGIGSTNYVLTVNSGLPSWQPASSGSPGGSDGQIQYKSGSSFAGAAGLAYQSASSPNVTVTAQNAAHVPLQISGAASQSANLVEWKSSTPTLLTAIDSAGKLVFGSSGDTNLYRGAADTLATDDDINIKTGKALKIDGSSSGTVTVKTAAAAGTWTLTLPTSDGNTSQFLQTDGSGVTSWADVVTLSWTEVTGTSQTAAVNSGYITNNAGLVTVTLPSSVSLGDMIRVVGKGAGGWKLVANSGQKIYFGSVATSTAGYLQSNNSRDAVTVVCVTANTDWEVIASQGNITYA